MAEDRVKTYMYQLIKGTKIPHPEPSYDKYTSIETNFLEQCSIHIKLLCEKGLHKFGLPVKLGCFGSLCSYGPHA